MSVLGIIARPRANDGGRLRSTLEQSPGVEVALEAPDGRLVLVVVDCPQRSAATAMAEIAADPHVMSMSLVYEHSGEDDSDEPGACFAEQRSVRPSTDISLVSD